MLDDKNKKVFAVYLVANSTFETRRLVRIRFIFSGLSNNIFDLPQFSTATKILTNAVVHVAYQYLHKRSKTNSKADGTFTLIVHI